MSVSLTHNRFFYHPPPIFNIKLFFLRLLDSNVYCKSLNCKCFFTSQTAELELIPEGIPRKRMRAKKEALIRSDLDVLRKLSKRRNSGRNSEQKKSPNGMSGL